MNLLAIIRGWRVAAEYHSAKARNKDWADWVREGQAGQAARLRSCADELESTLAVGGRTDDLALEVARRFTLDTEPQRRASLQCAVADAINRSRLKETP